jgi:hypothetical protein
MAINHQIVTVDNSGTSLVSIPQANAIPYENKVSISIQNLDSNNTVYLGAAGVSGSVYGYALAAGTTFAIDLLPGDKLFGTTGTNGLTAQIAVLAAEV